MDYNYVRKRNAAKAGDKALTEHYKRLYEAKPIVKSYSVILNYIIALLILIAISLGAYILFIVFKENKTAVSVVEFCKVWRNGIC